MTPQALVYPSLNWGQWECLLHSVILRIEWVDNHDVLSTRLGAQCVMWKPSQWLSLFSADGSWPSACFWLRVVLLSISLCKIKDHSKFHILELIFFSSHYLLNDIACKSPLLCTENSVRKKTDTILTSISLGSNRRDRYLKKISKMSIQLNLEKINIPCIWPRI